MNELGALGWERMVRRGHDDLTASTRRFQHAEDDAHIGVGCRILGGWPHPTSTWKRSRLRWLDHIGGQGLSLELFGLSASTGERVALKRKLTRRRVVSVLSHDTQMVSKCGNSLGHIGGITAVDSNLTSSSLQ